MIVTSSERPRPVAGPLRGSLASGKRFREDATAQHGHSAPTPVSLRDHVSAMRDEDDALSEIPVCSQLIAAPKRRRIMGKQPSPEWRDTYFMYQLQEMTPTYARQWRGHRSCRQMWRTWYNLKSKCADGDAGDANEVEWSSLGQMQKRQKATLAWQRLSKAEQAMWIVSSLKHGQAAWPAFPIVLNEKSDSDTEFVGDQVLGLGPMRCNYKGRCFLITYNGDWGHDHVIWKESQLTAADLRTEAFTASCARTTTIEACPNRSSDTSRRSPRSSVPISYPWPWSARCSLLMCGACTSGAL